MTGWAVLDVPEFRAAELLCSFDSQAKVLHAQTLVQRDGALQLGHTSELRAGAHLHPAHKEH